MLLIPTIGTLRPVPGRSLRTRSNPVTLKCYEAIAARRLGEGDVSHPAASADTGPLHREYPRMQRGVAELPALGLQPAEPEPGSARRGNRSPSPPLPDCFPTACPSIFRKPMPPRRPSRWPSTSRARRLPRSMSTWPFRTTASAGLNVSVARQNADTRYLAEVAVVRDENSGMSPKSPYKSPSKNFRLLVEGESRQGVSALRVARVNRTAAGTLQLDHALRPAAAGHLRQRLPGLDRRRLVEILVRQEQHARRPAAPEEPEPGRFHRLRHRQFLAALHREHALPAGAPHLRDAQRPPGAAVRSHAIHCRRPDHVLPQGAPARPAGYDHDDLQTCFTDLDEKLRFLLETVVPSNFVSFR